MTGHVKSIARGLVAMLVITAAPIVAHAGTLTIYNDNCTTLKGLKKKNWVKVHVDTIQPGGTNVWVKVRKGESETIWLIEEYEFLGNTYTYYYVHEAQGTTGGDNDVSGREHSSVTCRKGSWFGICQCLKDH